MSMGETTVRRIAWRVSTDYRGGFVFAEDQVLFVAGQYAEQVVEEHNTYQALRRQLAERDELVEAIRAEFPQLVRLLEEKQQEPPAQSGQSSEEEEGQHG